MQNIAKQGNREATVQRSKGFALPMAMGIGLVMLALAGTGVMVAQSTRNDAVQRREVVASMLVGDSAIAHALVQLSDPNNGVLLARDYDPINPQTGKNYLGPDGVPKSSDETTTAVDQWTGYNPSTEPCFQQLNWSAPNIALTGTIGTDGSYTIRAYRYDKKQRLGTMWVEGKYKGQTSNVTITVSLEPILDDFPGIVLIDPSHMGDGAGKLALRNRQILGSKSNVYYIPASSADSSLTGNSAPGEATRPSYLNALYASANQDGATGDNIEGKIFACEVNPQVPPLGGTDVGTINTSRTLIGSGGTEPTRYQASQIALSGTDTLTVDTTNGPVFITLIDQGIVLRNQAKILNIRSDGQPPRVGDLRIMALYGGDVELYDQTCIQNTFLRFQFDELRLLTSGAGCPGGQNTNFEGVAWMEAILASKNSAVNRNINYLGRTGLPFDTIEKAGVTSGIAVPDDVTSLIDQLDYIQWPVKYKYGAIKNWQRVN
jgi:hypothetical protein